MRHNVDIFWIDTGHGSFSPGAKRTGAVSGQQFVGGSDALTDDGYDEEKDRRLSKAVGLAPQG